MFTLLEMLIAFVLLHSSRAHPLAYHTAVPKLIYQFPNTTYIGGIENVAITTYGHLLLNTNAAPHTYLLDPTADNPTAVLVGTYPDASICLGIAEVSDDNFAIVVGNWTSNFQGVQGSFSIWVLDVSNPNEPRSRLVTKIPEARALNGMTTIKETPNLVLVADSMLGAVWSVDVEKEVYTLAIQDPLLSNTTSIPIGINGLHAVNNTLYFSNTAQGIFGKVGITDQGTATGPINTISDDIVGDYYDDFAFDEMGNAYIANHPDTIVEVTETGGQFSVAEVAGPTSVVFAKGRAGTRCVLYVPTIDGKVYSIDIC